MSLAAGTRLGPYEIVAAIGAGGMGEVYRARDAKLNRDVAIKILPDLFAADPDRRARFDREAQTLAALDHPNIAQIHGAEGNALVMEFVEGEDLAQRLARGAVPLDEALAIARQIADALQAAHDRGVVHRDLKPANVKVRPDGTVKVLDFGLAKLGALESAAQVATSPTFTSPAMMTHAGIIIGTAAYMSPEQAKGKPVDRRADLWAFGVVLFEMLTGRTAFAGETITDVLAAVVTRDPDWSALPSATQAGVRRLLARCLQRDPRRRLADAGEAAYQIEEALQAPAESVVAIPSGAPMVPVRRPIARMLPWAVAVSVVAFSGMPMLREWRGTPAATRRYSIETPPKATLDMVNRPALAISPDGTTVAFISRAGGATRIYVRRDNEFDSRMLQGTDGASEPAFSPDGRWLAFFADNKLNKIPVDGGPIEQIAEVNDPRGLSWDAADAITYSPESVSGLFQVSPKRGSVPRRITTVNEKSERTHRWPQMLPGGTVIFTVGSPNSPDNYDNATVEALVPKTGERRLVLAGAAMARYVAPGYLVFARAGSLFGVPFDAGSLQVNGTPIVVAQGVAGDPTTGAFNFAVSQAGTFAYVSGEGVSRRRLVWVGPDGRLEPTDLAPAEYGDLKISPDGRRAAVVVIAGGGGDVWVYDLSRKTFTRLTFGGSHRSPLWSGDGTQVYYIGVASNGVSNQVMRKPADGSRDEEVLTTQAQGLYLRDVSPDGRSAWVDVLTSVRRTDIATLALEKGAALVPVIATPFEECCAAVSPDRRWVAYQANETSRFEIYVRDISGKSGRWQVSASGGEEPHWSADGRDLYFRANTKMMVARVEPGAAFQFSAPTMLFEGLGNVPSEVVSFDPDRRSNRFLTIRQADDSATPAAIRIVVNWSTELKQLMAGAR